MQLNNIDSEISSLEAQLKELRAKKAQLEDPRNSKDYAKTFEKYKEQYLAIQNKYCKQLEEYTINLTLKLGVMNMLEPNHYESYIEKVEVIECNNKTFANIITEAIDSMYSSELEIENKPFEKDVNKLFSVIKKSKYSSDIIDDLYSIED